MKAAWVATAGRLPPRQLHLLGAALLLGAACAAWFLALRAPLATLRALHVDAARLEAAAAQPRGLALQLAALERGAGALSRRLGAGGTAAAGQQELGLVGTISNLAAARGVVLHRIVPAPEQPALGFGLAALDAEASGPYAALLGWLDAVERAGPWLSVAGFEMQPAEAPGLVDMKVRIAAFRPRGSAP